MQLHVSDNRTDYYYVTSLFRLIIYPSLFTQKVANNSTMHTKKENKKQKKNKTYDTKKQCPMSSYVSL